MKLSDYLAATKIDELTFATKLGVSAKAVRHWLDGKRHPRPLQMRAIVRATGGAVTANDFFAQEAAE
jgi:DNA-binding transcriptional regulator YdaS (Cro superfamily)